MEHDESRKIAEYALPRLLEALQKEREMAIVKYSGNGTSKHEEYEAQTIERLSAKLTKDICWIANDLEAKERRKYL